MGDADAPDRGEKFCLYHGGAVFWKMGWFLRPVLILSRWSLGENQSPRRTYHGMNINNSISPMDSRYLRLVCPGLLRMECDYGQVICDSMRMAGGIGIVS